MINNPDIGEFCVKQSTSAIHLKVKAVQLGILGRHKLN